MAEEAAQKIERGWGNASHHPLDFEATSGRKKRKDKRNYIFSFGKADRCDHPTLRIVARGTSQYRCLECNYSFWLPTATMWPLHWIPIMAAMQIMSFVKEFGIEALEQVYRTPIGQVDGSPHKPVLPEGKSFADVLRELDSIDSAQLGPIVPFPEALAYPARAEAHVDGNKIVPDAEAQPILPGRREAED